MKFKIVGILLAGCVLLPAQIHAQTLKGAGAASTYPLLTKWFDAYKKLSGVRIDYQSIGVGGGLYQLKQGDANFAITDAPLEKRNTFPFAIRQTPLADENIAIVYNLAGLKRPLKISGPLFGAIMRGQITRWNDPRLKKLNPYSVLPDKSITVVKRDNRSGVNWATTRYLNQTDKSWSVSTTPHWQFGIGSKGCDSTSEMIKKAPNSIGFVEFAYAKQNSIACAEVENKGKFYSPNSPNYPVTTRHYLIWKQQSPHNKEVTDFARWVLADGQKFNASLFFKPLPSQSIQLKSQSLTGMGSTLICLVRDC